MRLAPVWAVQTKLAKTHDDAHVVGSDQKRAFRLDETRGRIRNGQKHSMV